MMKQIGRLLYKYRAIIALPFFIILLIFSRPTSSKILAGVFVLIGMALRIWAAGYIGPASRKDVFSAVYIVINGPYQLLKHPLYIGNFFLVLGVIILFYPPLWLAVSLIILFVLEYTIIIYSEIDFLKILPKREVKFKPSNIKSEVSTFFVLAIIYLIFLVRN